MFAGEIPNEIGNLRNLEVLGVQSSNLAGLIPASIFNISTLKELAVTDNDLLGSLPSSIDLGLPNLERLFLGENNFSGTIPSSLTNISELSVLDFGFNSFSGLIPTTFGNLRSLKLLSLAGNVLTSPTPDLSFLSSLTSCRNLEIIYLSENPINGILPSSIGNFSISMKSLSMESCNISGGIPKELGNINNLSVIRLGNNELTGTIPVTLGRLQKLQGLYLQNNKLEGSIPEDLCHLYRLANLYLGDNKLSGRLPACLGNLTSLRDLSLGSNALTSIIPSTLWNLKDILRFNLSSNSLNGSLLPDIGNLKVVIEMDLSLNALLGVIPVTIGGLQGLQLLSLRYNRLQGPIPESFGGLKSLNFVDMSNNNLSGTIPKSMEALSYLKHLNLSFNQLEGEIPTRGPFITFSAESFLGNQALCGSPKLQVSPCKTRSHPRSRTTVVLLIVLPLVSALTMIVVLTAKLVRRRRRRRRRQKGSTRPYDDANMYPQATWRRISYQDLLRATDGFSENKLLGMGSFGSVYKGVLPDGMEIAAKVFHMEFDGSLESFHAECKVMGSIRHRNLVKIISSCSNNDFKALVLEYMSNGSLEKCLYSDNYFLDILQRLKIMIDVASALEYLHFGYSTPIVHCDIKPSNVLLNESMVGHLSDFGIAKILGKEESMRQTKTLGTIGYMAPGSC